MAQAFSFPNYGLFNATYYLQQNPDVATTWTGTPLQHYIQFGALEGRAPDPYFNADFYRAAYPDLQSMNALQLFNHYCNYGYNEGRVPMLNFSNFNGALYLAQNPDVAAAGYTAANAISHFVAYGEYEGRTAYANNGLVINPVVNIGNTYTLTTGIDTFLGTNQNDTFNASVGAIGSIATSTLQNFDSLDGAGGTADKLNANLFANGAALTVSPVALSNIELINVAASGSATGLDVTMNLLNARQATQVSNVGSTENVIFDNIASSATTLAVNDVASQTTRFNYLDTSPLAQVTNLIVSNVTGGAAANIRVDGIETINLTSTGTTGVTNSVTLTDNALTTLNIAGASNLTLGTTPATATVVNGAAMTGNLSATLGVAGSLTGGAGNDSLTGTANNDVIVGNAGNDTITSGAGVDNLSGGLGDDLFVVGASLTNADTIDGGVGTNTISTDSATATSYVRPTTATITNIQGLTLSDALAGTGGTTLTMTDLSTSINTLNLAAGSGAAATVVGAAGTATINVTGGAIGAALTVNDTGTATTDVLNISNTRAAATADVFGTQNLVIGGYETVNISTGTAINGAQSTGTIAITPDTGGTTTLNISGLNGVSTGAITANVISASGLTGTAALSMGAAAVGATNITGSANADTIVSTVATGTTVLAGAGNDTITGGNAADSIDGQEGNDSINGGSGNDTIRGGAGDDTITATTSGNVSIDGGDGNDTVAVGATLNSADTIDGGAGVNTFSQTTALVSAFAGVTNFQALTLGAAMTQNMALFTGTTFTDVNVATGANTINNASASLNNLHIAAAATDVTFVRAVDTATDTLTVNSLTSTGDAGTNVTFNQENTLNFNAGATTSNANVYTLDAVQATQINVSGAVNESITFAANNGNVGGTGSALRNIAVDATQNTGTVVFSGATAIAGQNLTIAGSLTAANTLTGGAGTDSITGGAANDSMVGGAGVDTLNGGVGNDTLNGGTGGDVINFGTGTDVAQYSAAGDTYQGAITSGTTVITGIDLVSGAGVGDVFSIFAGASITSGTAVATSLLTGTATDTIAVVRGTFNTLTGIWTSSTSGTDVAIEWDTNGATTGGAIETVILVGAGGTVTGATTAANAFTLS